MCPQFRCNYHSACTIRASHPCFHHVFQLSGFGAWDWTDVFFCKTTLNPGKDELSEWMVFLGHRSVKEGSPALIGCLSSLSVVWFLARGLDSAAPLDPIKHNRRWDCILTLADLIRGKDKGSDNDSCQLLWDRPFDMNQHTHRPS